MIVLVKKPSTWIILIQKSDRPSEWTNGTCQPPRKSVVMSALDTNVFAYSAR
jgi:hypothetical protein